MTPLAGCAANAMMQAVLTIDHQMHRMGEPIFCGKFRTTVTGNAVSEGSFNWGVWVHARCRLQHLVPVLQDLTANTYQK